VIHFRKILLRNRKFYEKKKNIKAKEVNDTPEKQKTVAIENKKAEQEKCELEDFLSQCSNEELAPLVDILIAKSNNNLDIEEEYIKHTPDHKKYYKLIAKEIRLYGSNSLANFKRGGVGVAYDEVVYDVCKLLGVPCEVGKTIQNEQNLLDLGDLDDDYVASAIKAVTKRGLVAGALFGGVGLLKVVSDPAYSVTVSCVIHIAKLRKEKIQTTKNFSNNLVIDQGTKEHDLNKNILTIINSDNKKVLSFSEVTTPPTLIDWNDSEAELKDISSLNLLLQTAPSLAIKNEMKTKKIMEVVINGSLAKAKSGGGFRGFTQNANGQIQEHANLFDSSKLSTLISAGALFHVASVITAKKHLADISAKLTDIKASVKMIELFQATERKSKIIGAIEYFEQIAPSVLKGNYSQSILNQIEAKESELLSIQNHLIEDIKKLNLDRELTDQNKFGSAGLMKQIEEYQEKILTHHKQLLQCIRARGCGWQLLSAYPDFPDLVANRKDSLLKILEYLKEENLLDKSEKAIRYNIKKLDSLFNSSATLGKRKLELLHRNKSIVSDVNTESTDLKNTLLEKTSILSDMNNPVAKMIVKIENGKIVAVSN